MLAIFLALLHFLGYLMVAWVLLILVSFIFLYFKNPEPLYALGDKKFTLFGKFVLVFVAIPLGLVSYISEIRNKGSRYPYSVLGEKRS